MIRGYNTERVSDAAKQGRAKPLQQFTDVEKGSVLEVFHVQTTQVQKRRSCRSRHGSNEPDIFKVPTFIR